MLIINGTAWAKKGYIMYEYVTDAEVAEYRSYCAEILTELRDNLFEYGINTQFVLVGSGARNMVMRNGKGPYDLDYNLNIIDMSDYYWKNLKALKDVVRQELNKIVGGIWFSDCKDSTSVLTANIIDDNNVEFSFDVAIISKNKNGNYQRLIHNKICYPDRFDWNEVPNSKNVGARAKYIKAKKKWADVRETYKKLKNMYLRRGDHFHPSYICYVEAVNTVYNKIK